MIFSCAMACLLSSHTETPADRRSGIFEYLSVSFSLSKTTSTFRPDILAAMRAWAIGSEVKEYASMWTLDFDDSMNPVTALVHPPLGEKKTEPTGCAADEAPE